MLLFRHAIEAIPWLIEIEKTSKCIEVQPPGYPVADPEPVFHMPEITHAINSIINRGLSAILECIRVG